MGTTSLVTSASADIPKIPMVISYKTFSNSNSKFRYLTEGDNHITSSNEFQ